MGNDTFWDYVAENGSIMYWPTSDQCIEVAKETNTTH
jgi:hypothetical protein